MKRLVHNIVFYIKAMLVIILLLGLMLVGFYFVGDKNIKKESIEAKAEEIISNEIEIEYKQEESDLPYLEVSEIVEVDNSYVQESGFVMFVVYHYGDSDVSVSYMNTIENAVKRANITIHSVDITKLNNSERNDIEKRYELDGTNPYLFKIQNGDILNKTQSSDMIYVEKFLKENNIN